ncbi:MAG: ATP-dependent helicase, partial [Methyloglobulus sp.]|nr:ATP-dependent helicase [Methyloglobulus sp.]
LIEQYQHEHNVTALDIASALAKLVQGDTPLLMQNLPKRPKDSRDDRDTRDSRPPRSDRSSDRPERFERSQGERKPRRAGGANIEMETFRIEVGHAHGVKPGNIVGAIANETGIDGDHIARIKIEQDYSTVELPAGMPKELFNELKKVRVVGQALNISRLGEPSGKHQKSDESATKPDKSKKRISSSSRRAKPKAVDA